MRAVPQKSLPKSVSAHALFLCTAVNLRLVPQSLWTLYYTLFIMSIEEKEKSCKENGVFTALKIIPWERDGAYCNRSGDLLSRANQDRLAEVRK